MLPEYVSPNFSDTGMFVALSIVGGLAEELCITCGDAIASEQVLSSKSRGFGDTGFSRITSGLSKNQQKIACRKLRRDTRIEKEKEDDEAMNEMDDAIRLDHTCDVSDLGVGFGARRDLNTAGTAKHVTCVAGKDTVSDRNSQGFQLQDAAAPQHCLSNLYCRGVAAIQPIDATKPKEAALPSPRIEIEDNKVLGGLGRKIIESSLDEDKIGGDWRRNGDVTMTARATY